MNLFTRLVLYCLPAICLWCCSPNELQAQGSSGSHGYGVFRDGDGYLLPWRDQRVAARQSRIAARQAARASHGYGSSGSHSYESAGYGSAGSTSYGYGSAGSTSYESDAAPSAPDDTSAMADEMRKMDELLKMRDRLHQIKAEQDQIHARLLEMKAKYMPDQVTRASAPRSPFSTARFAKNAAAILKEKSRPPMDRLDPSAGDWIASR